MNNHQAHFIRGIWLIVALNIHCMYAWWPFALKCLLSQLVKFVLTVKDWLRSTRRLHITATRTICDRISLNDSGFRLEYLLFYYVISGKHANEVFQNWSRHLHSTVDVECRHVVEVMSKTSMVVFRLSIWARSRARTLKCRFVDTRHCPEPLDPWSVVLPTI